MAFNIYLAKKYCGLLMVGIVPLAAYVITMIITMNMWYAIGATMLGVILSILIFNVLAKHPFTQMIEGKGIAVLTFDSKGMIQPFLVNIMRGSKISNIKQGIDTIFNRDAVFQLYPAKKAKGWLGVGSKPDKVSLTLEYDKAKEYDINYVFMHYPCMVYNTNLEEFVTKEGLSTMEEEAIIRHSVIYLKKKVEELTSVMRDFARHVIEHLNPKKGLNIFGSPIFWVIVIIIALAVIFFMFGGSNAVSGLIPSGSPAGSNIVNPKVA